MVHVSLRRQGHHALLSVTNPGPAIPDEDLCHIFKRSYRDDKARNHDDNPNGSYGLGLAIAEQIVNEHRGKIWAVSKDGVNTFAVMLPQYTK